MLNAYIVKVNKKIQNLVADIFGMHEDALKSFTFKCDDEKVVAYECYSTMLISIEEFKDESFKDMESKF